MSVATSDVLVDDRRRIKEEQEEPEPQPIKVEQIQLWVFQDAGQLLVKQESSASMVTAADEELFHNDPELEQRMETKQEPEPVEIKKEPEESEPVKIKEEEEDQDEDHLTVKQEPETIMVFPTTEQTDRKQLLSGVQAEDENQGSNQNHSGSSRDEDLQPEQKPLDSRNQRDNSELERQKSDLALCGVCGKRFTKPYYLTAHLRTHTGEKPHPCDMCDKSFSTRSNLIRHLRTHTGEKPFPCDMCDRAFSTRSILTCHQRTHTDERPFHCELCDKLFRRNSHLADHLKIHTENLQPALTVCEGLEEHLCCVLHSLPWCGDSPAPRSRSS
ncbi:zinc finger protein 572-like isoform X3 [Poecilia reticulata]|uniref:zinc finger protein 572-like isoform X3 n=1 Tax=Poecilia reticulata TaxID=8081 RepID=UPI0004A32433|nr:PREDICTED: zinc finger protein 572-like isoform X3 [Poecilia reticulata]